MKSGSSRDDHVFSGLNWRQSESTVRFGVGGLRDPIASDWEQSNDNISNTCLGRIDESARYTLRVHDTREQEREAEAFHDR